MGDEDVIRRRLLIDGDGTGDDRRLNVLLKTLIKWCNSSDEKSEESKSTQYDRMLAQLAQCEFAVTKSQLGSEMMAAELQSYESLSKILENGIEIAKDNIEKSKADLAQAKTVRKNRIEYDVLAKVISEQPDRKETLERLGTLKTELSSLETTKQQLESRLSLRKKQFHVLVTSIHQLQALLDEPDDLESISDDVEMKDIVN
ncbi:THO complex subunit 7 homolog [Nymphalis io]|uniref:THO complex subunit 7 homolog n=1 Tax=Vanessa cardui TaxID=171605 RepID=UPI001F13ECA1|nr:THO complex subunit 7 homolog [Vanessa cardui]XP_047531104.1 THO complex subunit 7 homolog [Vanessa atalanta]XP_050348746.1 THO complex subunit 7 homolog [Nymphalis io]